MLEMKERLDFIKGRMDGIQVSMETAVGAVIQTIERHEQQLLDHEETILRLEKQLQQQAGASAKVQADIDSLRGAHSEVASTVQAVRAETARLSDAPMPQVPRAGGGWDRQPDPTTLQANASCLFRPW